MLDNIPHTYCKSQNSRSQGQIFSYFDINLRYTSQKLCKLTAIIYICLFFIPSISIGPCMMLLLHFSFPLNCQPCRMMLLHFSFPLNCQPCRMMLLHFSFPLNCQPCRMMLLHFSFPLKCQPCTCCRRLTCCRSHCGTPQSGFSARHCRCSCHPSPPGPMSWGGWSTSCCTPCCVTWRT